jgi:PAS domain S-box-containing protein
MKVKSANNRSAIIASVLLVVFILLSVWLIKQYISQEHERDLQSWQDRLSVIAESKKRSIESWLGGQIENLNELASNPLLQIYLSVDADTQNITEVQRGQIGHLRNLITATASRAGVFSQTAEIKANTESRVNDGVAIVNADAELRLATRGFPANEAALDEAVRQAFSSKRSIVYGIYLNEKRSPRLILVVPVNPVQLVGNAEFAGAVVAVINPYNGLYDVVAEQWLTTSTDESVLITGDEFSTAYISPLKQDFQLFHEVPRANENNAANYARDNVANFAIKTDYMSQQVLVTSRRVAGTNWVLLQKIAQDEALRESSARREFIFTVFLLAVFIITVIFIAVWRHATSLRLQKTGERLQARTDLLNAVSDNIRDHILLLDHENRLVFINRSLAESVACDPADVRGKALNNIFSVETAEQLMQLATAGGDANSVCELNIAGEQHIYHVAVAELSSGRYKTSRLFVLHDITRLHEAQQKHHRLLEGIIATLVRVTDKHDPHCAHHSERTREVAIAIAQAMSLPQQEIETLGMASQLANIGKLHLPRELLTKMEPLTQQEETMMRENINVTVEMMQSLSFDGPVVEVIKQKNEYLDGSGYPQGLSGDAIRTESRILAVANAFVAMTSARAYRAGKPIREVLDILLQDADKHYDRAVVAALFHVAESRNDWSEWQTAIE